jgi:hypothetical protein
VCAPAVCTDAVATAASVCNGQGDCLAGAQTQCGAGCSGDACAAPPAAAKSGCASSRADASALAGLLLTWIARRRRRAC